jgi:2-amino-4-hydroxy-6-hydroxymethyldihydropteridine diphosphokinase
VARVFVSIGSNIDRYRHIACALDALDGEFDDLLISPVYQSESVGFEGDDFLNLVVAFNCEKTVGALSVWLRQVEDSNGRRRDGPKFSSRTLDIDILSYDQLLGTIDGVQLPRDEIVHNAFVLRPLVDIAPKALHPELKMSYQSLWSAYDKAKQKLWPVDFLWQDKKISCQD